MLRKITKICHPLSLFQTGEVQSFPVQLAQITKNQMMSKIWVIASRMVI